jgi:hypothetical protein
MPRVLNFASDEQTNQSLRLSCMNTSLYNSGITVLYSGIVWQNGNSVGTVHSWG